MLRALNFRTSRPVLKAGLVITCLICTFFASACWAVDEPHTTPEPALKRKATDARNALKAKLPSKTAKPLREMKTKTNMPKSIQIKPSPTPLTTGFDLIKTNNQLFVRFRPGTVGEHFASERPFVIQLVSTPPVEVSPQVITEAAWPRGMNQMPITVKNAKPGKPNLVQGIAAFWACKAPKPGVKESCRKTKADFQLSFVP